MENDMATIVLIVEAATGGDMKVDFPADITQDGRPLELNLNFAGMAFNM